MPPCQGGGRFLLCRVAQENDRNAAALRPERKTPGGRQAEGLVLPLNLAGDGAKNRAGRAFLQRPQHFFHGARAHHDKPGRIDPEAHKSGAVQLAVFLRGTGILNPQNRSAARVHEPGKERQCKAAGAAGIPAFATDDFMQRAGAQSGPACEQIVQRPYSQRHPAGFQFRP